MFTILYADDTCVLLRGTDLSKLIKLINSELNLLSTWFKSNKLSLNTGKTFYTVFHRARLQGRPQDLGGGGGKKFFFSDLGICMSLRDMLRMAKPCALLGGFGGMPPENFF